MGAQPNIIICTCDQLRAFETGCYGNPVIRTPNVDRLAAQGLRFEHAVTNFPVCMAARSVLLSGQHNRTATGGVSNVVYGSPGGKCSMPEYPDPGRPHLPDETLPEVLRRHGYCTSVIGKWHIHSWPHDVGFEDYLIPRVHHSHTNQLYTENGGPEFAAPGYSVDFEAARVEQFLRRQAGEPRPFFLYYNISPPHCPVADAPEEVRLMYRPEEIPVRPNVDLDRPLQDQEYWFGVYRWDYRYYDLQLPFTQTPPEGYTLRHLIAEYYGMTTWMDRTLGQMLDALDASGLADETIVLFTSDHGDNLGSHGLVQKGGPNEESIRVPLIIRGPGVSGSGRVASDHVASTVDITPSLLAMAGLPAPSHVQGQTLAPLIREETGAPERNWAVVETSSGAAIRTPRHMCFHPFTPDTRSLSETPEQCYDLDVDPFEMSNLAAAQTARGVTKALGERLIHWDHTTPWMT